MCRACSVRPLYQANDEDFIANDEDGQLRCGRQSVATIAMTWRGPSTCRTCSLASGCPTHRLKHALPLYGYGCPHPWLAETWWQSFDKL